MNRLSLCNSLIQKCGISGGSMVTTVSQTGEAGRVVSWIDEAWLNIQLAEPRWNWMREPCSFTTTYNQYSYAPAADVGLTDFGSWKIDSFRRYITSTGVRSEIFMTPMRYDTYRDTYLFGNMRLAPGDPLFISEGPDLSLNLGLIPNDVGYTINGEYFRAPVAMTTDTDSPDVPSQYHMLVVYRAMMMYGAYESAQEVLFEGTNLYNAMLRRLMRDQMEDISSTTALA